MSSIIGQRSCKKIMKEKTPLLHKFVCFQVHNEILQLKSFNNCEWEITSFSKPYVTSVGALLTTLDRQEYLYAMWTVIRVLSVKLGPDCLAHAVWLCLAQVMLCSLWRFAPVWSPRAWCSNTGTRMMLTHLIMSCYTAFEDILQTHNLKCVCSHDRCSTKSTKHTQCTRKCLQIVDIVLFTNRVHMRVQDKSQPPL